MGETVCLGPGAPRAGWRRVLSQADGYAGWVREWGLVPASAARARRWNQAATATVAVPLLPVLARPGSGIAVGPLFLGARVIPGRRRGDQRAIELPDGRRGWVEASGLRSRIAAPPGLLERVSSLLGVPYLWGGRTPAGLDCSAFVQLVLGEQGLSLPRDARDQHAACRRIPQGSSPRLGDLVFFAAPGRPPGHVGLALGDGYFAHSRALVRIASVERDNALCDKALLPQFLGWYRPRRGGSKPGFARGGTDFLA
jgi:cell wall-associated NlpC family hydrolase